MSLNFPTPIWVKAEIGSLKESRGHYFLELIEKEEEGLELSAKARAVFWNRAYRQEKKEKGNDLDQVLKEGQQVMLKVAIQFHELHGLSLVVSEVDISFTIGQIELKRQEILASLKKDRLLEKNSKTYLPPVIQNLAVISSATAAGYIDFCQHLEANPYGYKFKIDLHQAAMQGVSLETEVVQQLENIKNNEEKFDAVLILRGGGSKLDLAGFDNLEVCRKIAKMPLPVLTGIGHEIDHTIADEVAFQQVKTPTAAADLLIEKMTQFESNMLFMARAVFSQARFKVEGEKRKLQAADNTLLSLGNRRIQQASFQLENWDQKVKQSAFHLLEKQRTNLGFLTQKLELLLPEAAYKRGFSLTTKEGKILKTKEGLTEGDVLETYLEEGVIISIITKE